ncbi:MAG: glycerol-3-phosphate cytidylyltransferase [Deltaproteobacteria bacterium SG8_13]|nr:MAG: glycerol-3-phosphate cytidylyltransferase [Deltaproteobacteria bacterium SG8_13]
MRNKLRELSELKPELDLLRNAGKRIVFTNGCFDILHAGHVRYLTSARQQGDLLVVGLNSDRSVRDIKGPQRPLVSQQQRAEVLAGLWCVDFIVIFDEPDPLQVIQTLRPDVLVKGDDWPDDRIIGADVVKAGGGRVVRVPVVPGISTSRIIERIVDRCGARKE